MASAYRNNARRPSRRSARRRWRRGGRRATTRPPLYADRKKGECNAAHRAAGECWGGEHEAAVGRETFGRDILPGLQGVSLGAMVCTTGLSLRYCSLIRREVRLPHPRHWDALQALGARADAITQLPQLRTSESDGVHNL